MIGNQYKNKSNHEVIELYLIEMYYNTSIYKRRIPDQERFRRSTEVSRDQTVYMKAPYGITKPIYMLTATTAKLIGKQSIRIDKYAN